MIKNIILLITLINLLVSCNHTNSKIETPINSPGYRDIAHGHWKAVQSDSITKKPNTLVLKKKGEYIEVIYNTDISEKKKRDMKLGYWGISNNIFFTIIFAVEANDYSVIASDHDDPLNYNAYEIIKLNEDVFQYKDVRTGEMYNLRRKPL